MLTFQTELCPELPPVYANQDYDTLRALLLRLLFQLPYRRAARELACNYLYQQFCGLLQPDRIDVPSAKSLERYEKMVSPETLQALVAHLNHAAAFAETMPGEQALNLERAVELGVEYVDATALKARVHHPVDWLLLRDAVRTLTLAITQVRKRNILSRRPKEPRAYRSTMNKLCIEMTHARRTPDALKKTKKRVAPDEKTRARCREARARTSRNAL